MPQVDEDLTARLAELEEQHLARLRAKIGDGTRTAVFVDDEPDEDVEALEALRRFMKPPDRE